MIRLRKSFCACQLAFKVLDLLSRLFLTTGIAGRMGQDEVDQVLALKPAGPHVVPLALDDLDTAPGILTPAAAMGEALLTRLQENAGLDFSIESSHD